MQPVKRSSTTSSSCLFVFLGVVFVLTSCAGLAFFVPGLKGNYTLANLLSGSNIGGLIGGAVFGLAFLVVGAVMLVAGARVFVARTRVTAPEVTLSTQSPQVGDVVTLSYKQNFRSGTDVQGIRFQLLLRERATYRRGTDTITVRHDNVAQEYQLPGRRFNSGEGFQDQRQFKVQGMHSFKANHNELTWLIHVQVEMAGWPAYEEEYPLQVAPVLAR
jgi:hypothetical protein